MTTAFAFKNVFIIVNRGVDAENDLYLGKASKIVSLQFADFPDFKASWLVKATWVNMTLPGAKLKVKYMWFSYKSFIDLYF